MTYASTYDTRPAPRGWLRRSEAWLDEKGKGAWIAAMVLGFVFFWPLGLALLAYMIWSKRMFNGSCAHRRHRHHGRHGGIQLDIRATRRSSGNTAFDAYKQETLDRLEREQEEFEAFLQRLRDAKDKAEFDQFMDDRARHAAEQSDDTDDGDDIGSPDALSPDAPRKG